MSDVTVYNHTDKPGLWVRVESDQQGKPVSVWTHRDMIRHLDSIKWRVGRVAGLRYAAEPTQAAAELQRLGWTHCRSAAEVVDEAIQ